MESSIQTHYISSLFSIFIYLGIFIIMKSRFTEEIGQDSKNSTFEDIEIIRNFSPKSKKNSNQDQPDTKIVYSPLMDELKQSTPISVNLSVENLEQPQRVPNNSIFCRICLDSSNSKDLIVPCSCKEKSKFVHKKCIKKWLADNSKDNIIEKSCKICNQNLSIKYKYSHTLSLNFGEENKVWSPIIGCCILIGVLIWGIIKESQSADIAKDVIVDLLISILAIFVLIFIVMAWCLLKERCWTKVFEWEIQNKSPQNSPDNKITV
ncbi:unnamed protein product [Blepharisma stoltei]|uniref:RING-CH-type domain-containing protein n=1 Tax=Blepharisma stoltei TaxID=1481888 RepID=A0AAU9J6P9_9CILI|nr:unnamed protein product [Blepharisma stoltei]